MNRYTFKARDVSKQYQWQSRRNIDVPECITYTCLALSSFVLFLALTMIG